MLSVAIVKGSVKEPNKFHNYETEKITRKASDVAEYIELFGSFTEPFNYKLCRHPAGACCSVPYLTSFPGLNILLYSLMLDF